LWLFSVTRHFLFLILLAWLFAVALEPGIRALIARGRSRGISAAIVGGGTLLVDLLLAIVFGKLFFDQVALFVRSVPDTATSLIQWVNGRFGTTLDTTSLMSKLNLSQSNIQTWAGTLSGGVLSVVGSLASVVFDLLTVVVFGFYFAGDGPNFFRTLASGMNPRRQKVFVTITDITTAKTGGYVASKSALAGLSALFHGIFFAVIGVPYWLPFALLVGVSTQFVPMVGTYIGIALPVLATVFVSPWKAIAIDVNDTAAARKGAMAMLNSAIVNQTVASVRNGALLSSARYQPAPNVRGSRATRPGNNEPRKTSPASHGLGRREGLVG